MAEDGAVKLGASTPGADDTGEYPVPVLIDKAKYDDVVDDFTAFRTAVRQYFRAQGAFLGKRNTLEANDALQRLRSHERAVERLLAKYPTDAPAVGDGEGV